MEDKQMKVDFDLTYLTPLIGFPIYYYLLHYLHVCKLVIDLSKILCLINRPLIDLVKLF